METVETFVDPVDHTEWHVDMTFLGSAWTCIWDRGCQGILDEPAPELGQGCCSVGAELLDDDEGMRIAALAATLADDIFEFSDVARVQGVFAGPDRGHTRIVDGACIFLNRPGFPGGGGCALHIAAARDGDSPIDWKPSVCWQLPLKVERSSGGATLRRWRRDDWGTGGDTMAWCCTEAPEALVGTQPVAEALAAELDALVGPEVAVAIRERLRD